MYFSPFCASASSASASSIMRADARSGISGLSLSSNTCGQVLLPQSKIVHVAERMQLGLDFPAALPRLAVCLWVVRHGEEAQRPRPCHLRLEPGGATPPALGHVGAGLLPRSARIGAGLPRFPAVLPGTSGAEPPAAPPDTPSTVTGRGAPPACEDGHLPPGSILEPARRTYAADRRKLRHGWCYSGSSLAPKDGVFAERQHGRTSRRFVPMRGGRRHALGGGSGKRGGRASRGRKAVRRARGDAGRRRPALRGPGRPRKGRGEAPKGSRRPAAPGGELPERGIDPAGGRRCRPQTGGKPGRPFGTREAEIARR